MRRNPTLSTVLMAATAGLLPTGCGLLPWPPEDKLDEITGAIDQSFDAMDADLADAAAQIAQTGLDSAATRTTLSSLCVRYPDVADCSTVSPEAILTAVEPAAYQSAEGADIGDQPQMIEMLQTHQPVVSDLFTAVEGFPAMDLQYPLLQDGTFTGSVSMLIKPADYFARIIEPLIDGTGYSCMVLQLDTVILYDTDPTQVGRNTLTDPLYANYPGLQEFARHCVEAPDGMGSYRFTSSQTGTTVRKYARWATVEFHGVQWRVLLIGEGRMHAN